jgi:hypothetical protein
MKQDFAKLKEVLANSPDAQASLKIFKDTGVITAEEAHLLEAEIQAKVEAQAETLSFNEIIAALVEEDCPDIAERLHKVLLEK